MLRENFNCEMLNKTMIVYKSKNLYNNKIYIGKTSRLLKTRIIEHMYNSRKHRNNSYIDNAIEKWGISAFDISVVEECTEIDELNDKERYWIKFFDCKAPKEYNLCDGGEGVGGQPLTLEHRNKISTANKGRKFSKETRQKMAETWMGHTVTDETRIKISDSSPNKRSVICLETGKIFESITLASKWAGVSISAISSAVRGKPQDLENITGLI